MTNEEFLKQAAKYYDQKSYTLDCGIKGRPSRITILKAYEKLVKDKLEEFNK